MKLKKDTASTNIKISRDLQQILKDSKNKGESYDNCIRRLIKGCVKRNGVIISQEDSAFGLSDIYYNDDFTDTVEKFKEISFSMLKEAQVGDIFKPEEPEDIDLENKSNESLEVVSKTDKACYCVLYTHKNDILSDTEAITFTWL